jgi:hypothetical protein
MKTIAGVLFTLFVLLVVAIMGAHTLSHADEPGLVNVSGAIPICNAQTSPYQLCLAACPTSGCPKDIFMVHGDGTITTGDSKPALFLQSIKLNALDGKELERHNISGPYDTVEECSKVQQANAPQHPVVEAGGPPTITVFSCVVFNGDSSV